MINPGDILLTTKGIAPHEGIYVGSGRVFHNHPDNSGEAIVDLKDFAKSGDYSIKSRVSNPIVGQRIMANIRTMLRCPGRYDVLRYNCQHSVNKALSGVAHSPLIKGLSVAVLVVAAMQLIGKLRQ